jgi:hypothetical protein
MMRNLSLKTPIFTLAGLAMALFLGACMDQIDPEKFLEDPVVQEIIEETRVKLSDRTGDGLRIGDKRITGISNYRYYAMLEGTTDFDDPSAVLKYVQKNSTLSPTLTNIGMVSTGNAITGLDNKLYYTIFGSTPLSGSFPLTEGTSAPGTPATPPTINASDGVIITPYSPTGSNNYYLNLNNIIGASTLSYRIVKFAGATVSDITIETGNIINLSRTNNADYVIINIANPNNFYSLHVTISDGDPPPPPVPEIKIINVIYTPENGGTLVTPLNPSLSQAALMTGTAHPLTLSVTGLNVTGATYVWKYNGTPLGLAATATTYNLQWISGINDHYLIVGDHRFTVEITTTEGKTYSVNFKLEVTAS